MEMKKFIEVSVNNVATSGNNSPPASLQTKNIVDAIWDDTWDG
jgi:hypothetical protein